MSLEDLRVAHAATIGTPITAGIRPEVVVALIDVAEAAQFVVSTDRGAWQQSDLDNAVIRLGELVDR